MSVTKNHSKTGVENNSMKSIKIGKITLNIGAGKNEDLLKKGLKLLEKIAPLKPVKTLANKRIPGWGLRPGLAIGCKVTVRKDAVPLLKRLVAAKNNTLAVNNFDERGNFAFGIPEYIDIMGLDYDPDLKIMGLEVAVTLERSGYRVKYRKIRPAVVGGAHRITKDESIAYIRGLGIGVE